MSIVVESYVDLFPRPAQDVVKGLKEITVPKNEAEHYKKGTAISELISFYHAKQNAPAMLLALFRTALAAALVFATYHFHWSPNIVAVASLGLSTPVVLISVGAHFLYFGCVNLIKAIALNSFTKVVAAFGTAAIGWAVLAHHDKYKLGIFELPGSFISEFAAGWQKLSTQATIWVKIKTHLL